MRAMRRIGRRGGAEGSWPATGESLLDELSRFGRLGLLVGEPLEAVRAINRLAELPREPVQSVAELILGDGPARSDTELLRRFGGARFLVETECLFWQPHYELNPLRLLQRHAASKGLVAVWPGVVDGATLRFSGLGRRDHFEERAADLVLLHAKSTIFPDQVPFTVERLMT